MSQLFSAEPQSEFDPRPVGLASPSADALQASAEVQLAVRKFWDVVRSSAETIVTLRQEVAQLKVQKPALVEVDSPVTLARLAELEGELTEARQMNEMLEAEVANGMRRVGELEAALEDGRATQVQMRADVTEVIQTLEGDLATSAQQRSQLEQELAGMSLRVAELEARLDEKAEQLTDATELTVRFEIMQREREELEQRLERLQQRASDLEGVVDEKNVRNEELSSELATSRREVAEFELQLSARQTEIQDLQQSLSEVSERLQTMELTASESLATESTAEVRRLTDEVADLQDQLRRAMAIVDMYRAAGLRHLEDPTQRDQMSLFAIPAPLAPLPEASIPSDVPMAGIPADHTLISDAELTSVADRLDDLAARVEELLRIS
jgi:DNA repair exonuclease SbcCD ATPase subunit